LRKFAPLHEVTVARSLAEAETLAAGVRPELFVLDLDPPFGGELDFLKKLSAQYPEARALVIAVGTSAALRAECDTVGAIQFLEKPFELAEFGAAVQALVGQYNGQGRAARRAMLRDLNLIDFIQLKCLALSSAILRIKSGSHQGVIHFRKGQISHAAIDTKVGVTALEEIVAWPLGEITESELPALAPQTIDANWPDLLLPIVRRLAGREKSRSPAVANPAQKSVVQGAKKILVIDDTEMLLIFVADVLTTANASFRVLTAASGGEGLRLAISEAPDLILLDYSLGDMTGDNVCRALLDDEATSRIPILMMSGHPTELARTAQSYPNVVAALPKPFLSGALIKAVERALAASPLPPAPSAVAIAESASAAPPAVETQPSSPNGHGPSSRASAAKVEAEPPSAAVEPPPQPPTSTPQSRPRSRESGITALFVRNTALRVTFSFDVVALELTASLQTASARLEPINRFVVVEMVDGIIFETGFRLGSIELGQGQRTSSLRLIPTRELIPLPAMANSFAIGRLRVDPETHHLELKAAPQRSMRVQLTAPFVLTEMELTAAFEVAALRLQSSGNEVLVRNRADNPGTLFQLQTVELDETGELRALRVRPLPND
jgi:DNA-binding response OmpR family regulator